MRTSKTIILGTFLLAVATGLILLSGCSNKMASTAAPATLLFTNETSGYFTPSSGIVTKGATDHGVVWTGKLSAGLRKEPPLSSPASAGEVWIIARSEQPKDLNTNSPGSGALLTKIKEREVALPLKHTEVHAFVQGFLGTVEVSQQFQNPYSSKIEAVYVFPLPHDAAVSEFVMVIGERQIRGIIRERKQAEELYAQAKREGYVVSLLTEERPNVFTQAVANIEPGKEISVNLKYFHTLSYVDGWCEFVFPMVVGPRFNPEGSREGIGAVPRGAGGTSQQSTEVQYLKPGERSGHEIGLTLDIQAGVPIEEFECKTHKIVHESNSAEHLSASIDTNDGLPNRDFVFRYRIGGEHIKSSLRTYQDERGGYFSLMLYPPREIESLRRQPLELVFVIDSSGSMDGQPIEQAKAAIQRALQLLQPRDSFQLITFSMRASQFGARPLPATAENIRRASRYLASLNGEGGTMMIEGIKAALDFPHDPDRLRFVCFLTDGYIGNETEILGEVHKRLGASRIFSFGIGSSVNRYLIEGLGKVGRGAVAFLGPKEQAAQIMEAFFNRISHPALTDLTIDWGTLSPLEIYPREMPDLFVGRPLLLTGRFTGSPGQAVRVSGNAAGQRVEIDTTAVSTENVKGAAVLPNIWARMKIAELAEQATYAPDSELPAQIRQVALDYGLMSSFTAFMAVDASARTAGSEGTTVPVAVPVPEGVKYETTVEGE